MIDLIQLNKNAGFIIAALQNTAQLQAAESAFSQFFAQSSEEKQLYARKEFEQGYYGFPEKEFFLIKDKHIPAILNPCREYLDFIHTFSKQCLAFIAAEMGWQPELLWQLIDDEPLPENQLTSAVLGGFHYHGCEQPGFSTDIHQDLGLLTILPRSTQAALEIYDFAKEGEWLAIENQLHSGELLVMFGETLTLISNGKLIPATHRVKKTINSRSALIYRVRAKPNAALDSNLFENACTGKFSAPFNMSAAAFIDSERRQRKSVNGTY